MKAIEKAWGRVKASRTYHKLFISQIDYQRIEEMKNEAMLKYRGMGWF